MFNVWPYEQGFSISKVIYMSVILIALHINSNPKEILSKNKKNRPCHYYDLLVLKPPPNQKDNHTNLVCMSLCVYVCKIICISTVLYPFNLSILCALYPMLHASSTPQHPSTYISH